MANSRFLLMSTLALFLVVVLENEQVLSAFCPGNGGACPDNSQATPCCGFGSCNVFCCACKGGCRTPFPTSQFIRTGRALEVDPFERFDKNGDGHHDIHESFNMYTSSGCGGNFTGTLVEFRSVFNVFDKDGNGKLSWDEINTE